MSQVSMHTDRGVGRGGLPAPQSGRAIRKPPMRTRRRPSMVERLLRRLGWPLIFVFIALSIAGLAFGTPVFSVATIGAERLAINVSGILGARVDDIQIEGCEMMRCINYAQAIEGLRGQPILGVDLAALRSWFENDPWIDQAVVERRLPHTLCIHLDERHPLAIWQHGQRFLVIDAKGKVILDHDIGAFSRLPVVIGDDAPAFAEDMLLMLESQPDLKNRVTSLTRMGGRRWDLHFDNGVVARLPEEDAATAWARLAQLQTTQHILDRDILAIDFRLPDRMIVQVGQVTTARLNLLAEPKRPGPASKSVKRP